jgi:uncharacterized delta-60 repeat protein
MRLQLGTLALALTLATAVAAEPPLDGILDNGFGNGGAAKASFNLSTGFADRTEGLAVSTTGRIYLAATVGVDVQGTTRARFGLARFLANGQLDSAFSTDGLATPVPAALTAQSLWANGVIVRADGKPIVYGYRLAGGGASPRMLFCQYAVAGNLDPGYDGDGCAEPSLALIDNGLEVPNTALGLPDERVLVGGRAGVNPLNPDHQDGMVLMLGANGQIDASFGASGHVLLRPPGSTYTEVTKLLREADGRYIIVGFSDHDVFSARMFTARLSANGQLDTGYGINGYATVDFDDLYTLPQALELVRAAGIDSQGRVYLCGQVNYGNNLNQSVMAFARLTTSGALDPGFSGDGRVLRPFIDVLPSSNVRDCALDAEERLVAAVQTGTAQPLVSEFGALRLLPDGSEDPRFATLGQTRVALDIGGAGVGHDSPAALAVVGDAIIIAGTSFPTNGSTVNGEAHTMIRLASDRTFANGFESD